jgi:hypothetical protein
MSGVEKLVSERLVETQHFASPDGKVGDVLARDPLNYLNGGFEDRGLKNVVLNGCSV